jgi:hypothetical protein
MASIKIPHAAGVSLRDFPLGKSSNFKATKYVQHVYIEYFLLFLLTEDLLEIGRRLVVLMARAIQRIAHRRTIIRSSSSSISYLHARPSTQSL